MASAERNNREGGSYHGRTPSGGLCRLKEVADELQENPELVVVDPMAGPLDGDHPGGAEMPGTAVLLGIGGPAFLAIDEQCGARDARPELLDLRAGHVIGRPGADVVVELPAIGTALVLNDAVLREVAGLRLG